MTQDIVHVLLVEDDEDDYLIARDLLQEAEGITAELEWVDEFDGALKAIGTGDHNVYLIDYRLGARSGLELIEEVLDREPEAVCVLLTGHGNRELENQAMQLGAADFLRKESLNTENLERSIRHALARKQILNQLIETRKGELKLKDEFLSNVSHELRTPIAVIHQFATILQDGLAGDMTPELDKYLGIIVRNVGRLAQMVTELVEVTRAEAGKLTVERSKVSLASLLEDAETSFKLIADEAGIELRFSRPAEDLDLFADPKRFHQILSNLVQNAVEFTPTGGSVEVIAGQEGNTVRVDVTDNGKGIPAEMCDLIFERLVQVPGATDDSRKGLGLGLHIARELLHLQEGSIWVESEEGVGSTFSFALPVWSLPEILLPVVERSRRSGVPILLLRVRPWDNIDLHPGGDERRQIASALERYAFPMDVVVPPMTRAGHQESFYIAAAAAAANASVIALRIKDALAAIDVPSGHDLQPEVAHVLTETDPDPTQDVAHVARQVARRIEEQIAKDNEVLP